MQTKKQHREYMRMWYKKYPGLHHKNTLKNHSKQRELILKMKQKPCIDCKHKYNSWQMHFDHRNPNEKLFTISSSWRRSTENMLKEMAKCDVVCANCHANRTYYQRINKII